MCLGASRSWLGLLVMFRAQAGMDTDETRELDWIARKSCYRRALRPGSSGNITGCWLSPYTLEDARSPEEHTSFSDLVDTYDKDRQPIGTKTAWEVQTSCLWHRTVYILPALPTQKIIFQRRAPWKWRMGGLLDIGLSETVEQGESWEVAARRAVQEELGSRAEVSHLNSCCDLDFTWQGDMPRMKVCESTQNKVFRAKLASFDDLGDRDSEVQELFNWTISEYEDWARKAPLEFAPWVHAVFVGCPDCFSDVPVPTSWEL